MLPFADSDESQDQDRHEHETEEEEDNEKKDNKKTDRHGISGALPFLPMLGASTRGNCNVMIARWNRAADCISASINVDRM